MSSRPIRVLRLAPVLDFGGVESRFVMQSREWNSQNIEIDYACFWKDGEAANQIRTAGKTVRNLGQNPSIRNPKATLSLLRLLKKERYDVVHSSIGDANFHAMLCSPFGPWKTIIEEAGMPQRTFRNRLIHRALYALPDKIVCVSQASADNLLGREWAPKHKIMLVHNAIDVKHFHDRGRRAPNPLLFRAIGRLTAVKNYDGLLRAFNSALYLAPGIRLEFIGEGEDRSKLESLIQELKLSDHVKLCGYQNNIEELHRTTGWLLVPSHREGFGLVAAEAMAAGVPVIGSNAGGLPEVFGELSEQWTLPPQDSANWTKQIVNAAAMAHPEYLRVSERMRLNSIRFHPSRYVNELESLYTSLCA